MSITLFIPGEPRPGGSKTAKVLHGRNGKMIMKNGRPIVNVTDAGGEKTKNWRSHVTSVASEQYKGEPLDGPLAMIVVFIMPRPKSHFRTGKNAGQLRPDAPLLHTKKPDTTKLVRALEDSLTGIVWRDDTQVRHISDKRYGTKIGAWVYIAPIAPTDSWWLDALTDKAIHWNLMRGTTGGEA